MTGVAIANSMIGSSMIIFPVTFNNTGVITNVLVVVIVSLSSSSWLHSCPSPADYSSPT
jgi:amino acid permease